MNKKNILVLILLLAMVSLSPGFSAPKAASTAERDLTGRPRKSRDLMETKTSDEYISNRAWFRDVLRGGRGYSTWSVGTRVSAFICWLSWREAD